MDKIEKPKKQTADVANIDQLLELVNKQIAWGEENNKLLKKISKHVFWAQIYGWFKLAIIVIPILLGILYLKPIVENFMAKYVGVAGGISPLVNLFLSGSGIQGDTTTAGINSKTGIPTSGDVTLKIPAAFLNRLSPDLQNSIKVFITK